MEEDMLRLGFGAAFPGRDTAESLQAMEGKLKEGSQRLLRGARCGEDGFGWFDLPDRPPEGLFESVAWLGGFDSVVQIGIGGSALGNRMISSALSHPFYNELTRKERMAPRFYIADNADPEKTSAILDMIDPSRTAFIVASKSGSTAETMANFIFFLDALGKYGVKDPSRNILVVTDKKKGALRSFASETGCRSLSIPAAVGGRYSVLSAVGLLSAGSQGVDVSSLLRGASAMKARLLNTNRLERDPARILAASAIHHFEEGRNIFVLLSYSDNLDSFSEWFCQLWAESLGKKGWGSTPLGALGATDQHSLLQLFSDGPDDKLYLFLVPTSRRDLVLPEPSLSSLADLSYLKDKSMASMLEQEARSTASALARKGRPLLWLEIPVVDEFHLGGLVFFFEYATALAGLSSNLNPFDQPGVEQGKRYTYGLMGRPLFENDADEAREQFGFILAGSATL